MARNESNAASCKAKRSDAMANELMEEAGFFNEEWESLAKGGASEGRSVVPPHGHRVGVRLPPTDGSREWYRSEISRR